MTDINLRHRAANALRWSIAGRLGTQMVRWTSTLIVIRLLAPEDYGLMAMAMGLISFAVLFNELGANAVIVRNPTISDQEIGSLQGLVAVINLALGLAVFLAAPWASEFYGSDITTLLRACCLVFVGYAIGIVQESLLIRAMDFKSRMLVETLAQLSGSAVSLALALLGFGVWALAMGIIVTRICSAIGFMWIVPKRYAWRLRWLDLRPHAAYASAILAQKLIGWLPQNFTTIIIGLLKTPELLGIYVVSLNLAFLPLAKFGAAINQVSFATYARGQDIKDGTAKALRKSLAFISFFLFPYSIMAAVSAPAVVPLIIGPTWQDTILPIQLIVLALPCHAMNFQLNSAANAVGQARLALYMRIVSAGLTTTMIILGATHSITLAAAGWLIATPLSHIIGLLLIRSPMSLSMVETLSSYIRPILSGAMGAFCFVALGSMNPIGILAIDTALQLIISACVIVALSFILDRKRFLDFATFMVKG